MKTFKGTFIYILLLLLSSAPAFAVDHYWIGDGGSWTDGSHWSLSSGGPACGCVPGTADKAIFDAASFNSSGQSVTQAGVTDIGGFDWSGIDENVTWSGFYSLNNYGDYILSPQLTMSLTGNMKLFGTAGSTTIIDQAGATSTHAIEFDGIGAQWSFQSDYSSNKAMTVRSGAFITNSYDISITSFSAIYSIPTLLLLGDSEITLTSTWNLSTNDLFVIPGTSTIRMTGNNSSFVGAGKDFNEVITEGSNVAVSGNNTINTLTMLGGGNIQNQPEIGTLNLNGGHTYEIGSSQTLTIVNAFNVLTDCGTYINIEPTSTAPATISMASGSVNLDYVYINSVNATGGASFNVDNASVYNASGWTETAPAPGILYWIGGTGDWHDGANWSTSSGGAPANCIPNRYTDVFFNINSFGGSGEIVSITERDAYCRDMVWSNVTGTPVFQMTTFEAGLHVYGNFELTPNMAVNFTRDTYFRNDFIGFINLYGHSLGNVHFQGPGAQILQGDLNATYIYHHLGTFNTAGHDLFISGYNSNYTTDRTLMLNSSYVTIAPGTTLEWNVITTNFVLDAGTSTIECTGSSQYIYGEGLTFNDLVFSGINGTVGNIAYANNINFSNGGVLTNVDQALNASTLAGTLTLSGTNSIGVLSASNNLSVSFGTHTADVVNVGGDAYFSGTGTYGVASVAGDGEFYGLPTFGTLTLAAGTNHEIQSSSVLYIEDALIANGDCSNPIAFQPTTTANAIINKNGGAITLDYAVLKGITANGTASFTANNSTDDGDNVGWTINQPATVTYYWIGGDGDWVNPANWATSSGGAPQACLPGRQDNVVFDANSFSAPGQEVRILEPVFCNGMLWQSVTNGPTLTMTDFIASLSINGSMFLDPGMTVNITRPIYFTSPTGLKNLSFAGNQLSTVYFAGGATEWRVLDEMRTGLLYHESGSINTNNQSIYILGYISITDKLRRLRLGSSVVNITTTSLSNEWSVITENYILVAGTSLIRFPGNNQAILGSGLKFYDVEFSGTGCAIQSCAGARRVTFLGTGSFVSNAGDIEKIICVNTDIGGATTVDTVIASGNYTSSGSSREIGYMEIGGTASFNGTSTIGVAMLNDDATINDMTSFNSLYLSAGKTYTLESGQTQRVNDLLFGMGACDQQIFLQSSGPTQASLQMDSGVVDIEYASLTGINAIGATNFVVNSATDGSNNSGWTLLQPPTTTYYWVGNGGNWNDPAHWSTSSGGAPQVCLPTSADDVVFDLNSFSSLGETVLVDANSVCRSMFWSGLDDLPIFDLPSGTDLQVYGSLELSPDMTANISGDIIFEADTGNYNIISSGHTLNDVFFVGDFARWTLGDTFRCDILTHERGRLDTDGQTAFLTRYSSSFTNSRWLELDDSDFYISFGNASAWVINTANFDLDAGTSNIIFTGVSSVPPSLNGPGLSFYEATWTGSAAAAQSFDTAQILNFNNTGQTTLTNFGYVESAFLDGNGFISGSGKVERLTTQGSMDFNGPLTFNDVVLQGDATFTNHPRFSNLTLEPGAEYIISNADTLIVDNFLFADGTAGSLIFLRSSSGTGHLRKDAGQICMDYINLQNIHTKGAASFNVGASSVDLGGNAGWNFGSCVYSCDEVSTHFITDLGTTVATLNFDPVEGAFNYLVRWREAGGPWNFVLIDVNEPTNIPLSGLAFGATYEWQVKVYCNESQTLESLWSPLQSFATTCVPPSDLAVTNVLTNAATFNWAAVPGAFRYTFQGRFAGTTPWFTLNIPNPSVTSFDVDVLSPNKTIEWRMRTTCSADGSIQSAYSPIQMFTTQSIPTPPPCMVDLGPAMVDVCGLDTVLDAGPGFQHYLWNTGDTTQTITVNTPGTYFVIAQWEFCTTGDTIQIDFPGCLLRTADDARGISVYPNPANNYTQVNLSANAGEVALRLIAMDGRTVLFEPAISDNSYTIDLQGVIPGIYIIEISEGSAIEQRKLVVTD